MSGIIVAVASMSSGDQKSAAAAGEDRDRGQRSDPDREAVFRDEESIAHLERVMATDDDLPGARSG
jgi:hypothetical protein